MGIPLKSWSNSILPEERIEVLCLHPDGEHISEYRGRHAFHSVSVSCDHIGDMKRGQREMDQNLESLPDFRHVFQSEGWRKRQVIEMWESDHGLRWLAFVSHDRSRGRKGQPSAHAYGVNGWVDRDRLRYLARDAEEWKNLGLPYGPIYLACIAEGAGLQYRPLPPQSLGKLRCRRMATHCAYFDGDFEKPFGVRPNAWPYEDDHHGREM